jgi:hypothetical protein
VAPGTIFQEEEEISAEVPWEAEAALADSAAEVSAAVEPAVHGN